MTTDPNAVLEDAAKTLYDHPTSKTTREEVKPAPNAEDEPAQRIYGPKPALPAVPVPEPIEKLRANTFGWLDPASSFSDITDEDLLGDGATLGATTERTPIERATAQEMRRMFADLGLSNVEAKEFARIGRHLAKNPPDEETEKRWVTRIQKRLMERNHNVKQKAESDLKLVQKLVQRDPRVRKILNETRLGSHPEIAEILIDRSQAEKLAGRL